MAAFDFNAHRLFVEAPLHSGARIVLDRAQLNYLVGVLRLGTGASVRVFNGRDGEWLAQLEVEGRKSAALVAGSRTREQESGPDLLYLFAPLKHARFDYMVQKAVEMGVSALQPVVTRRTSVARVNLQRMRANAIEAVEQCGILAIPQILDKTDLNRAIAALEPERHLVFCDEEAPVADPLEAFALLPEPRKKAGKLAVLVGPEGGFTDDERGLMLARPGCVRLSLGPRILRADTAAVAALAIVQCVLGDWRRSLGS